MTTPLAQLPVVVDGPGEYATRDGRRVTVRTVHDSTPGTTSFGVKGSMWTERRGVLRPRGQDIWHISGRHMVLQESGRDIVARWKDRDTI